MTRHLYDSRRLRSTIFVLIATAGMLAPLDSVGAELGQQPTINDALASSVTRFGTPLEPLVPPAPEPRAGSTGSALWAWGANAVGQVGDGTTVERHAPKRIGSVSSWARISAGGVHSCATRTDHTLWCWGSGYYGQVGDGTTADRHAPKRIGDVDTWARISAGYVHSCATRTNFTLWCWGYNHFGQVGDGTTTNRLSPKRVGDAPIWASVSGGGQHTCATRTNHTLWCWGATASARSETARPPDASARRALGTQPAGPPSPPATTTRAR